jgi:hypothetical protein
MKAFENLRNAIINVSASGDTILVAAPTEGYIAVDHINFLPTAAVSVKFKSGSTDITGTYPLDTKQAYTIENAMQNEHGVMTCKPQEAFVINLGGAVQVGGFLRYRVVGNS